MNWDELARRTKGGVFISHIADEKEVAMVFKQYLQKAFGRDKLHVFVASDNESMGGGKKWFEHIIMHLSAAKVVLVLVSHDSVHREWVNFEAGYGDGAGATVIPVLLPGMSFRDVSFPLAGFQGFELKDATLLFTDIAKIVALPLGAFSPESLLDDILRCRASARSSGLQLKPFIDKNVVRFELANVGDRDQPLIEIEASVPKHLIDPQCPAISADPRVLEYKHENQNGRVFLTVVYRAGIVPGRPNSGLEPLPDVIPPGMTKILKQFQFVLADLRNESEYDTVRYKLVVKGRQPYSAELALREIRSRSRSE